MKPYSRLTAAAVVLVCGGHATFALAKGPDLCAQTTRAAQHACESEGADEYWIAVGVCANQASEAARLTCRRTAKQNLKEARSDCADQADARNELCTALGPNAYTPPLDPARFVSPAAAAAHPNPFFPLVPGSVWHYAGDGEEVTVTVTDQTKVLGGITATLVRDVVTSSGAAVEDTSDYFAQDVDGTVWYLGEFVKNFENGELTDLDGSFFHATNGALGGTQMMAVPAVGTTYRQEFALGDAEDAAAVIDLAGSATVPGASCAGTCLVTREFTPIEPGHEEHKYYAPGIGMILQVNVETGARLELLSYTPG